MNCFYYIMCNIKHKDQSLKRVKLKHFFMKLFFPQPVAHVPINGNSLWLFFFLQISHLKSDYVLSNSSLIQSQFLLLLHSQHSLMSESRKLFTWTLTNHLAFFSSFSLIQALSSGLGILFKTQCWLHFSSVQVKSFNGLALPSGQSWNFWA